MLAFFHKKEYTGVKFKLKNSGKDEKMARVTIEDCIKKVPNHFNLVLLAANRTKSLEAGVTPTLPREDDKNTVLALREIEAGTVDTNILNENVIADMQKFAISQEEGLEAEDLREVDAELSGESPMYADTEFVDSDAFQVVHDDQVDV